MNALTQYVGTLPLGNLEILLIVSLCSGIGIGKLTHHVIKRYL